MFTQRWFLLKVGLLIIPLLFLGVTTVRGAEAWDPTAGVVRTSTNDDQTPAVLIANLSLEKTAFVAGEVVKGSFILWNDKNNYVPDVYYKILFAGKYKNDVPTFFYESTTSKSISVGPLEQKPIKFSYTLPKAIPSGSTGIVVMSMLKNGRLLGVAEKQITVTGGLPYLETQKAAVSVDGKTSPIQAGPTVSGTAKLAFVGSFNNSGTTNLTIQPRITLYAFDDVTKAITTLPGEQKVFPAGTTTSITFEIPTTGYKPQVYIGSLDLIDAGGVRRGGVSEFRYIIGGNIFNIFSLTTTKVQVRAGETIPLTLRYGGNPTNIMEEADSHTIPTNTISLTTVLYNELNTVVGSSTEVFDGNLDSAKNYTILATQNAQALRAEVTATKDGQVISTAKFTLSPDFDTRVGEALARQRAEAGRALGIVMLDVGLGILVGLFIIWLIIRKNKTPRLPIAILVLCIVATGWMVMPKQALAGNLYNSVEGGTGESSNWKQLDFYVDGPAGIFDVNDPFRLTGTLTTNSCGNHTMYGSVVEVYYNGQWAAVRVSETDESGTESRWVSIAPGASNPFRVASGHRTIFVRASVWETYTAATNYYRDYAGTNNNQYKNAKRYLYGYYDFNIRPTVTLVANPDTVHYGANSTLRWTSTDSQFCRSNDFNANNALQGSSLQTNLTQTTNYGITCYGYPMSNHATAHATVTVPPLPSNLSVTCTSPTNAHFTWTLPPGYTRSYIRVWDSVAQQLAYNGPAFAGNSFDLPVVSGRLYGWYVHTAAANDAWSNLVYGTAFKCGSLTVSLVANPPQGLAPLSSTLTANAILAKNTTHSLIPVAEASTRLYRFQCSPADAWSAWQAGNQYGCLYRNAGSYVASVQVQDGDLTGSANTTVTATAQANPPTVTLHANPNPIERGAASNLTWESTNATACSGSNFNTAGALFNSTGVSTGPLITPQTYGITCTGPGGQAQDSVIVNLIDSTGTSTPTTTPPTFKCQPEDPADNGHHRITQAPVGWPVNWVVIGGGQNQTYTWGGTVSGSGVDLKSRMATYSTVGPKTVTVTSNGITARCDLDATGRQFKISVEPGYQEF